jgi:hypothetical protein
MLHHPTKDGARPGLGSAQRMQSRRRKWPWDRHLRSIYRSETPFRGTEDALTCAMSLQPVLQPNLRNQRNFQSPSERCALLSR